MAFSIRLDAELEARIAAYCTQSGLSKSKVIALSIEEFLDRRPTLGLYDLAKDLLPVHQSGSSHASETRRSDYRNYAALKHHGRKSRTALSKINR